MLFLLIQFYLTIKKMSRNIKTDKTELLTESFISNDTFKTKFHSLQMLKEETLKFKNEAY